MSDQISINPEVVVGILRKMKTLEEEISMLTFEADKELSIAETMGWDDSRYHAFLESFGDTKRLLGEAVKRIGEDHVPFLRQLLRAIEEI